MNSLISSYETKDVNVFDITIKYIPIISSIGTLIGLALLFKHFYIHDALAYFPMAASNISTIFTIAFYSAVISIATVSLSLLPVYEIARIVKRGKENTSSMIWVSLISLVAMFLLTINPDYATLISISFLIATALITVFEVIRNIEKENIVQTLFGKGVDTAQAMILCAITPSVLIFSTIIFSIPSGGFEELPTYYVMITLASTMMFPLLIKTDMKFNTFSAIMTSLIILILIATPVGNTFAGNVMIKPNRIILPLKDEVKKYLEITINEKETVISEMQKRENLIWVDRDIAIIKVNDKIIKLPSSHFSDSYMLQQ